MRCFIVLILMLFFSVSSFALPEAGIWALAKPLNQSLDANSPILSFTTPPSDLQMSIKFEFFDQNGCGSGPLGDQEYLGVFIDASHAQKSYYISTANMYILADHVLDPSGVSAVRCVKEINVSDPGSFVTNNTLCSGTDCVNETGITPNLTFTS